MSWLKRLVNTCGRGGSSGTSSASWSSTWRSGADELRASGLSAPRRPSGARACSSATRAAGGEDARHGHRALGGRRCAQPAPRGRERWGGRRGSRSRSWPRSPSGSARTPPCSRHSTPSCCGRCRSRTRTGWCGSRRRRRQLRDHDRAGAPGGLEPAELHLQRDQRLLGRGRFRDVGRPSGTRAPRVRRRRACSRCGASRPRSGAASRWRSTGSAARPRR